MKGSKLKDKKMRSVVELTSDKVQRLCVSEFHPHVLSSADVMKYFKVNEKMGLSQANVIEKHQKYGLNELKQEEKKTVISLFMEQFEDFLTRILLGAAFLSFLITFFSEEAAVGFTAYVEPIVIFSILVANSCVSVWQECRAEKSLDALKKLQPDLAWVLRDGEYQSVKSSELVTGDLCRIRVGDCVPADMRVIQITSVSLTVEQSQFTGESAPVEKIVEPLHPSMTLCELQAKNNMLFSSTKVVNGNALCIVTAIGMETELGKIQSAVHLASLEEEPSPLQKKLNEFGKLLSKVIGGICILVWVINYKNFSDPSHGGIAKGCVYYFKTAVALAVAAIPEGLTAVITSCLALGTIRMARKNAIVRKLNSVETLGCTTVICTDKTGTLTTNEMSCVRFSVASDDTSLQEYFVDGISYTPVGKIHDTSFVARPFHHINTKDIALQYFAACACVCNETRLCISREPTGMRYTLHGEPTEAALKVLVEKMGCPDMSLNMVNLQKKNRENPEAFSSYWADRFERLVVLEFTRDRKCMSVFCEDNLLNKPTQFVKGAPESILDRCSSFMLPDGTVVPMTKTMLHVVSSQLEAMEKKALRVLGLAVNLKPSIEVRKVDADMTRKMKFKSPETYTLYEKDLTFLGLVGLLDPPRTEIREAMSICRVAGVKVNMLTGDSQKTAESVALMTGILQHENIQTASITGSDFSNLSLTEQYHLLSQPFGLVFSRTEPRHKQMIIRLLSDLGEVTAMTGDGVNDAPALKQADIGISMGITGTEVAKEASDIVLADDNFMTIVLAIEEGRSIYNNMKAFIRYLISSNIGEVASIFLTSALGVPEGLAPVQLLWINLITDGFPATALGFNPPEKDVMKKPPRRSEDTLISHWHLLRYLIIGLYVGVATVGVLISWYISESFIKDGHTQISYYQLSHWTQCHTWKNFKVTPVYSMDPKNPCSFFTEGKIKASTLSLTVLIVIEMLNALNALSEDGSLLHSPPWSNPFLVLAIIGSLSLHCFILYHPTLNAIVGVTPLSLNDWFHVLLWSLPVLLIDEVIKVYGRYKTYYSQSRNQRYKLL